MHPSLPSCWTWSSPGNAPSGSSKTAEISWSCDCAQSTTVYTCASVSKSASTQHSPGAESNSETCVPGGAGLPAGGEVVVVATGCVVVVTGGIDGTEIVELPPGRA